MSKKLTEDDILSNSGFLDKIAIEVMKVYMTKQNPHNFGDSVSISRIAYKQALAMLMIRENSLITLAEEAGLLKTKEEKDG